MNFIKNFIQNEDGVTAIEYALIAALIAGVIAAGAGILGGKVNDLFVTLGNLVKKT